MATITFSGATLRSLSRDKSSCVLNFSSAMTAAVAKHMEWGELPDAATGSKMEGRLVGGQFILTPTDAGQQKLPGTGAGEINANTASCGSFQIVRRELEASRGKGHRRELRFRLESADPDAAAKGEAWLTSISDAKATLKLTYSVKAKAGDSPEPEEGDEE